MLLYFIWPSPFIKLSVISTALLFNSQSVFAQNTEFRNYQPDPTFAALSKKGTPKDILRGGGKRGCLNLKMADPTQGLKAIVPPQEGGGLSASANPTFWIQNPYVADRSSTTDNSPAITAILSIKKADGFTAQPFQKVQIQLPVNHGVVGVKLPQSITDRGLLAWTLTVVCDAENPARNPFVSGLVMIKPNNELMQRVISLSKKDQVVEFMRSGYWYDALAILKKDENTVSLINQLK